MDKLEELFEEEKIDIEVEENQSKDVEKGFKELTEHDREIACIRGLVPRTLKDCKFNVEIIKKNVADTHRVSKNSADVDKLVEMGIKRMQNNDKKVINFKAYAELCNSILSGIYFGKVPNRSYIIGAPDGFGKTSMVYEAIMAMSSRGMKVAPYKTLWELGMIKSETEINSVKNIYVSSKQIEYLEYKKAVEAIKMALNDAIVEKDIDKVRYYQDILDYKINNTGVVKSVSEEIYKSSIYDRVIASTGIETGYSRTGTYAFSEYLEADCLFCNLSAFSSREIETNTLDFIIRSREIKGLPTIVTTRESIEGYKKDKNIGTTWQEIITENKDMSRYGKLYHVSTYILNQKQ